MRPTFRPGRALQAPLEFCHTGEGHGAALCSHVGGGAEEGQATARAKEKGVLQSQLLGTAAGILQPRKFKVSLGKTGKKKSSQKRRERS